MKKGFFKSVAMAATLGAATFMAPANAGQEDGLDAWAKSAGVSVDDVMVYPAMALRRGEQGFTSIRVTVNRNGDIVAQENVLRADSSSINSAAKRLLKKVDFPALPADYRAEELSFALTLNYAIANSGAEEASLKREGMVSSREIARARGPVSASIRILDAD
ncbi:energy transducer TonB [Kordiimonas aestuarii]|uniref:energy transducer TonB n=1 Tax=Kordiimonas aestuarii TaxID=1005925 RepID=UPI0021D1538B|nr:energy transducer TonB [Kordiimonas aestuarii]